MNGIAHDLEQNFGSINRKRDLRNVGLFGEFTYSGIRSVLVVGARFDLVDQFKHIFFEIIFGPRSLVLKSMYGFNQADSLNSNTR